jgi:DNA-binding FadR family transcriptional regulator
MAELLAEHEQIVTAIADGTAAAGAPVLRQHARRVLTLQPALQQRHPDYFELAPG